MIKGAARIEAGTIKEQVAVEEVEEEKEVEVEGEVEEAGEAVVVERKRNSGPPLLLHQSSQRAPSLNPLLAQTWGFWIEGWTHFPYLHLHLPQNAEAKQSKAKQSKQRKTEITTVSNSLLLCILRKCSEENWRTVAI